MGWGLKSSSKKPRFSKKQKVYLIGKFQIGEKLQGEKSLSEEGNDEDDEDFDDLENTAMEAHIELLTKELVPQHPIMYETYNLCDTILRSQLKKFNISLLKEICDSLMIDATDILSAKRKQPYIEKIEELYTGCTCR
ncbi:Hypothetical predicted protein, partial [Paramuricea clavata]